MKSKRPIPPHRILMDEDVKLLHVNAWRVSCGDTDHAIPTGGVVPGWEPGMEVVARNTVELNESAVLSLGPTAADMKLVIYAIARTSQGLHTLTTFKAPLALGGGETPIELKLDGHSIAKDLSLHLGIAAVDVSQSSSDRLAPKEIGARLWNADWRARVEGGRARLAMEAVDLAHYFRDQRYANALVHVIVSEDPTTDVEQGLSVLLNSLQEGFVSAVSRREPQATAVLWDSVIRRVILMGAEHDYMLADTYPEGSIGEQWKAWFKAAFPRRSVAEVLDLSASDPSTFEAMLQSWTNMGKAFAVEEHQ